MADLDQDYLERAKAFAAFGPPDSGFVRWLVQINARPREPRECTYDIYTPVRLGPGYESDGAGDGILVHGHPATIANLIRPVSAREAVQAYEWVREERGRLDRLIAERLARMEALAK